MDKKMNLTPKKVWIPEEIILEIFSWLPVKSLLRFKCVTKFCNSIVLKPDFVDIHRCRSTTRPGGTKFLLQGVGVNYTAEEKKDGKTSASFLQIERLDELYDGAPAYSYLNCVNGLFYFWMPCNVQPPAIFNPSTREVRFLPVLRDFFPYKYSLGFEPEEKEFKVLLSTEHVKEGHIKHWVFTLGIDESWREAQRISPFTPYLKPSVCISGVINQFVVSDFESCIAAFDAKSEKFEIIALWNASHTVSYYELIEVKGKLAVIDYGWVSEKFYLWILEQTPKREWLRHIIRCPPMWKDVVSGPISSCTSHDGRIVFSINSKSGALCWDYDVSTKMWRELRGLPKQTCIHGISSYVERLGM